MSIIDDANDLVGERLSAAVGVEFGSDASHEVARGMSSTNVGAAFIGTDIPVREVERYAWYTSMMTLDVLGLPQDSESPEFKMIAGMTLRALAVGAQAARLVAMGD